MAESSGLLHGMTLVNPQPPYCTVLGCLRHPESVLAIRIAMIFTVKLELLMLYLA